MQVQSQKDVQLYKTDHEDELLEINALQWIQGTESVAWAYLFLAVSCMKYFSL